MRGERTERRGPSNGAGGGEDRTGPPERRRRRAMETQNARLGHG